MGNTVWLLNENSDEDEWDHSLIIANENSLNGLADELGIKRLSDYYDHSILAEEFGGEAEPNYVIAEELTSILDPLINAIRGGKLNGDNEIIEELEDCLKKALAAKDQGLKVRLAIVP